MHEVPLSRKRYIAQIALCQIRSPALVKRVYSSPEPGLTKSKDPVSARARLTSGTL